MDTNTFNFTLQAPYMTYQPILDSAYIASQEGAKGIVYKMLQNMQLLYGDIDRGKTTAELLTIKNGTFIPATSLSTTQIVHVNLFQGDIDKMPVFYPQQPHSTMDFFVTSRSLDISDIVDAHFTHQSVKFPAQVNPDPEDSGTYPIKTAAEAFKELQEGKGFITNYYGSSKDISITDVTLGFFMGEENQDYLMPIIVFHGNGEFYGYISAIRNEWIK
jgi:hypothetical protein